MTKRKSPYQPLARMMQLGRYRTLDDCDVSDLARFCTAAAQAFTDHAKVMDSYAANPPKCPPGSMPFLTVEAARAMADDHRDMAKKARRLADLIHRHGNGGTVLLGEPDYYDPAEDEDEDTD